MKKITDFIVDKRYLILTIVLLLTGACFVLNKYVVINKEIANYLPASSRMHTGMDLMDSEFKADESSTLNVMFKNLGEEDKKDILSYLKNLNNVEEVEYDNTEEYNKDGYTLYIIKANVFKDSDEASLLYDEVMDKYQDYEIETSGDIAEENKEVLPFSIIALAVGCATVILIIMCDSFLEPFLFLITIGLAIVLNNGTNIIFPSISNITSSIAAILQLALSMDYSIMLMNRYRQEKETAKNDVLAMKEALYKSFKSISSSSVTTVVGLLALVFMSFTIGRDLGFVLAKGVLFSLLTIFTCLPALILMFDKLIIKTMKKTPNFKLTWLGKWAYKAKYASLILFVLVFGISFFLKGNLQILFTTNDSSIDKIFKTNNPLVVVYKKDIEENVTKLCKELENDDEIKEVLCYGNTINEPLTYQDLKKRLTTLGNSNLNIEDYMLKIIYYNYFNQNADLKISINDFISFLKNKVYQNDKMNDQITGDMKDNIATLENFTNSKKMNTHVSKKELATVFQLNSEQIDNLLLYYNALHTNNKMTISTFVNFMQGDFLKSPYQNRVDKKSQEQLQMLKNFVDGNTIKKEMKYQELARLFNMNEADVLNIYIYYTSLGDVKTKLTLHEFSDFVLNTIAKDPNYQSSLKESDLELVKMLNTYSDEGLVNKEMTATEVAKLLELPPEQVQNIYLLYFANHQTKKVTIKEFAQMALNLKDTAYAQNMNFDNLALITENPALMQNETKYDAKTLSQYLSLDENVIKMIITLNEKDEKKLKLLDFVTFLLQNQNNPVLKQALNQEAINNLTTLAFIMQNVKTKYDYQSLATQFKLDSQTIKLIYSIYNIADKTISPVNFVTFLVNHQKDEMLKGQINTETTQNLTMLKTVMTSVLNSQTYNSKEMANLFNIDKSNMDLLYSYYEMNSLKKEITVSYYDFINFLITDVLSNQEYQAMIDNEAKQKLQTLYQIMNQSLNNKAYTKDELLKQLTNLTNDIDSDMIDLLYIYYGSENLFDQNSQLTVIEFVDYLNDVILQDEKFTDYIDTESRQKIIDSKTTVNDAKDLLIGKNYGRMVLNTTYELEGDKVFSFLKKIENNLGKDNIYQVSNSAMAYEMDQTFDNELNLITFLTIIFIFIVVAYTFKSLIIPIILVGLIQTSVYLTMGILSVQSGSIYFIALLIVQSILMGATVDYAILYTSYYGELRKTKNIKESLLEAYQKSCHTILTSASILTIVTLIVGHFGSQVAALICKTISEGTLCSTILILLLLPPILGALDFFIVKKKPKFSKN